MLQEFKTALKTWQKALPTVSWQVDGIAVDSLDPAQCLVQGALCFGAKADGLLACDKGPCTTNCTGTTSADPRNGEILGGLVFCEASPIPESATPIESGARTDKTQPQLTWEQAKQSSEEGVQLFGKKITARKIKLTFNAASHLIALSRRWLFLHELGHIYGLGHNFLASTAIKNSGAVRSVMDYLPFYAFIDERNAELGDWDVAAIRNLYWGTSLPEDYRACHHDEEGFGLCIAEDYGSATTNAP